MQDKVRLIDANAMRDDWLENGENEYIYDTNAVLESIDNQPTIDAVPVVRCAQCKDYELDCGYCDYWEVRRNVDDYCSRGARR